MPMDSERRKDAVSHGSTGLLCGHGENPLASFWNSESKLDLAVTQISLHPLWKCFGDVLVSAGIELIFFLTGLTNVVSLSARKNATQPASCRGKNIYNCI